MEEGILNMFKSFFNPIGTVFIVLFGFIVWIIYEADTGAANIFLQMVHKVPMGDKLGHIWLFGMLAFILNIALSLKTLRIMKWNMQVGSLLVLLFAVVEELSQGLFATRSLDAWDVIADAFGVYLAAYLTQRKR